MIEILASVVITLLGVIGTLVGVMYWDLRRQIRSAKVQNYNYTKTMFRLLHRLHPDKGEIIGNAMIDTFSNGKPNGEAKLPL